MTNCKPYKKFCNFLQFYSFDRDFLLLFFELLVQFGFYILFSVQFVAYFHLIEIFPNAKQIYDG